MTTQLVVNGLAMSARPDGRERTSHGFYFSKLIDWYSVPESKTEVRERPQADGAFGISWDFRTSLVFTIEGAFVGSDAVEVALAKQTLKRAAGSRRPVVVLVDDALGPTERVASCRSVTVADDAGQRTFRFAIDLLANDPNRYGAVVTSATGLATKGTGFVYPVIYPIYYGDPGFPGRMYLTNNGTELSWPWFEIHGDLFGGVRLSEVGGSGELEFSRDVLADQTLRLDSRTGRAYLDGVDVTRWLTRRNWFPVEAGATVQVQFTALGTTGGSPLAVGYIRPAY